MEKIEEKMFASPDDEAKLSELHSGESKKKKMSLFRKTRKKERRRKRRSILGYVLIDVWVLKDRKEKRFA